MSATSGRSRTRTAPIRQQWARARAKISEVRQMLEAVRQDSLTLCRDKLSSALVEVDDLLAANELHDAAEAMIEIADSWDVPQNVWALLRAASNAVTFAEYTENPDKFVIMDTTDEAPGAWRNGTRVVKVTFDVGDAHKPGAEATIRGSVGPVYIPEVGLTFAYFVNWDDVPNLPVFVQGRKIAPKKDK